jgi:4-nitrophenyl phosphatase
VTYQVLAEAAFHLEHGARFVATNADTSLPVEAGLAPGAGALQAALIATTGVTPTVIGKPDPRMLMLAMDALGAGVSESAMLGDRLDTDIQAAEAAGIFSILVLTGVTRRADLAGSTLRPDMVVADLPALMAQWPKGRL